MKKICGIYAIKNLKTGKFYIGQSVDILNRWRGHRNTLNRRKHHSNYLQNSYNKYGVDSFIYGVIEECERAKLNEREVYWINYYNSQKDGYNCADPTINGGRIFSEEDKIRASNNTRSYCANPKNKDKLKKARKKAIETRIQGVKDGLYSFGASESKKNIRIYNKDTYELLYCFDYYSECAEFLEVKKTTLLKVLDKLENIENSNWTYKGYIILRRNFSINKYKNRILIKDLNLKLQIEKQKKVTILKKEAVKKTKLSKEEVSKLRAELNRKNFESSGRYKVLVYKKDTGEFYKEYISLKYACDDLGFNRKRVAKAFYRGVDFYKDYIFKRPYISQ